MRVGYLHPVGRILIDMHGVKIRIKECENAYYRRYGCNGEGKDRSEPFCTYMLQYYSDKRYYHRILDKHPNRAGKAQ